MMEAHGFKSMNRLFLFGSGSYLANPKDMNDTPSILTVLGISTAPGTPNAGLGVNSVPGSVHDQAWCLGRDLERDRRLGRVADGGTAPLRSVWGQSWMAASGHRDVHRTRSQLLVRRTHHHVQCAPRLLLQPQAESVYGKRRRRDVPAPDFSEQLLVAVWREESAGGDAGHHTGSTSEAAGDGSTGDTEGLVLPAAAASPKCELF